MGTMGTCLLHKDTMAHHECDEGEGESMSLRQSSDSEGDIEVGIDDDYESKVLV